MLSLISFAKYEYFVNKLFTGLSVVFCFADDEPIK